MKKSLRVAVAAMSLSLLSLTACGSGVRVNGVKVDQDVPFLAVIEQAWHDQIAEDAWLSLAPTTHCWLPTDTKSGAIELRAFCGPVRHLKSEPQPGVFDVLNFTVSMGQDSQVAVDPAQVTWAQSGVELPNDRKMFHPSGDKPGSPDDVPTPTAPTAPAGLAQLSSATIFEDHQPPDGTLIVPGYRITVNQVGPVTSLPGEEDVPYYMPAAGEEFLGLTFSVSVDPNNPTQESSLWNQTVDTSIAYSVRNGGQVTALDVGGDGAETNQPDQTLVVSVPTGSDAELVVGVAGVEQTLSIRTGERTSTTAEGNYRPRRVVDLQQQYSTRTATKGNFSITHGVTFTDAVVTAFDPQLGWAPTGRMFVRLDFTNGARREDHWAYQTATINHRKTLTFDDRKVEALSASPIEQQVGNNNDEGAVILSVPTDTHAFRVTYAPQGTFAVDGSYADDDTVSPHSGSFTMKPLSFSIDLG